MGVVGRSAPLRLCLTAFACWATTSLCRLRRWSLARIHKDLVLEAIHGMRTSTLHLMVCHGARTNARAAVSLMVAAGRSVHPGKKIPSMTIVMGQFIPVVQKSLVFSETSVTNTKSATMSRGDLTLIRRL